MMRFEKNSNRTIRTILIASLLVTVLTQRSPITIDTVYSMELEANDNQNFVLTIPEDYSSEQNLYISAYSIINDPFEEPIMHISSEDYSMDCNSQETDLNDLCFIPFQKISPGQKFSIDLYCQVDCKAKLVAYLSENLELDLGDFVDIQSDQTPLQKNFRIYVPENTQFDHIQILFTVHNFATEKEGSNMYLNFGANPSMPTSENYTNVEAKNWGTTKGYYISKSDGIKPGDWIACSLIIGAQTSITLSSQAYLGNTRGVSINQAIFDFIEANNTKIYEINFDLIKERQKKTLFIDFIEYSGNPDIEFALNKQFTNSQKVSNASSTWIRFEIDVQTQMNTEIFSYRAYVKISGKWDASYAIYSKINFKKFIELNEGIGQYATIHSQNVEQFLFQDSKPLVLNGTEYANDQPQKRQIKLQRFSGSNVEVVIYLCKNTDSQGNEFAFSLNKCLIDNPNDFYSKLKQDSSFSPTIAQGYELKRLQVMRSGDRALFIQTFKDCLMGYTFEGISFFTCEYLILIYPKTTADTNLAITVESLDHSTKLRQGYSESGIVDIGKYQYFSFQISNTNGIKSILVYVNKFNGNLRVLTSMKISKPKMQDIGSEDVKAGTDKINYEVSQIEGNSLYISVYGIDFSDFVINVIVRRKSGGNWSDMPDSILKNQTEKFEGGSVVITDIQLIDGQTQKYILGEGQNRINFKYTTQATDQVELKVIELSGRVNTSVQIFSNQGPQKLQEFICKGGQCTIKVPGVGSSLRISVTGSQLKSQQFTILLSQAQKCYTFPVGTPLIVMLDPNQTDCVRDSVNKSVEIEIQNSLSSMQMLKKDVSFSIYFPATSLLIGIESNSYIITKQTMQMGCPQNDRQCEIQFRYSAHNSSAQFYTIIQKVDGILFMYDGVVQNVNTEISSTKGKYFAYSLNSQQSLDIFFESISHSGFVVCFDIISYNSIHQPQDAFPSLDKYMSKIDIYSYSTIESYPLSQKTIQQRIKANNIKSPILVLSVFGKENQVIPSRFSIQVTQTERILREGNRQMGFLEKGQIVQYQLYPSRSSLLTAYEVKGNQCLLIRNSDQTLVGKSAFGYEIPIENAEKIPVYFTISLDQSSEQCMYMISLQSFNEKILQISANFPTEITLSSGQTAYYLYWHNQNQPFRLFQLIDSGDSKVYATPISPSMIQQGLNDISSAINLTDYKYKGGEESYLQIHPSSQFFCFDCFYLIAVEASPSVSEQLVINIQGSPIALRQNSLVDADLQEQEIDIFTYYLYGSQFNITLGLLHGDVHMAVFRYGDEGNMIYESTFNKSVIEKIPIQVEERSNNAKYIIKITGRKTSSYHMQISNVEGKLAISQGVPLKLTLPPQQTIITFDSMISNHDYQLVIEFFNHIQSRNLQVDIQFTSGSASSGSYSPTKIKVSSSEKVKTYGFAAQKGHYRIILTASRTFDVVLIIPKAGLTQLISGSRFIGKREGIYEIYIPQNYYAMVELFECGGQVKLRGSSNYDEIASAEVGQNEVSLTHLNIGGHYVINAKNVTGEYYLRVQEKNIAKSVQEADGKLKYLIRYRLIMEGQPNPYQLLDSQNFQVQSIDKQSSFITITVDSIQPLEPRVKINDIKYLFTIGVNKTDVQNVMICSVDDQVRKLKSYRPKDLSQEKVHLQIQKEEVLDKVGSQSSYTGVLASIDIQVDGLQDDGQYKDVIFVYEPAEMDRYIKKPGFTTIIFFEIVGIILIIVSAIVLIYSIWYDGIRKFMGYQAHAGADLVEEDSHQQEQPHKQESDNKFEVSRQEDVTIKNN